MGGGSGLREGEAIREPETQADHDGAELCLFRSPRGRDGGTWASLARPADSRLSGNLT